MIKPHIGKSVLLFYTDGPSEVTLISGNISKKERDSLQVECFSICKPFCTFQWIFTDESGNTETVASDRKLTIS